MDNNSSSLPTFYNINICPETKEQEDISQYIPFDKCEKCTYYIIDHNKYLYCECDNEIPKENIHIGEVTGIHMPIPPGQSMHICDKTGDICYCNIGEGESESESECSEETYCEIDDCYYSKK